MISSLYLKRNLSFDPIVISAAAVGQLDSLRNLDKFDSVYPLRVTHAMGILSGMTQSVTSILRPGRTGNLGALRIVKAAQRTPSSVDPMDRHSVVVYSRNVDSLVGSLALCVSAPVSVTARGTETGAANLAQGQTLRAFAATSVDAKVRKSASSTAVSGMMPRPHLIRGRCKIDRPEMLRRTRKDLFDPSVPLLEISSRAVERKKPSAAGASSGCNT